MNADLFSLQFDKSGVEYWAGRYYYLDEDVMVSEIGPRMKVNGYLIRPDFVRLGHWKTPRSKPKVASNSEEFIRAVTQTALSTPSQQLRIEVLTLLHGVSWPTASVILRFGHVEQYPILDVRAWWSLGMTYPAGAYNFKFWWMYTLACRQIAAECNADMRTLDRSLW